MYLRTVYTVAPAPGGREELDLPLELAPADGIRVVLAAADDSMTMTVERTVHPDALEVVEQSGWFRENADGESEPLPGLRIADDPAPEHVVANDVLNAATFLTDTPFSVGHELHEDRIVAETPEEQAVLDRLGTDEPYVDTSLVLGTRTFTAKVESGGINALLGRSAGLRLYGDAVKLSLDVAPIASSGGCWNRRSRRRVTGSLGY
jgi:hypothetical protein